MEPVKVPLTAVNSQLTCVLCSGYLIDATTIVECLHSFCRSCLLRYLESNNYCPICDVQVYKSKPHLNIRSDTILQSLVYKMIPSLYQREMSKRRKFYEDHPEIDCSLLDSETRGDYPGKRDIFSPDDNISLSVCYSQSGLPVEEKDLKELEDLSLPSTRRFLNCPAAVTIGHLKKFIRMKHGLSELQYKIDFFYEGIIIPEDHTLMDVAYVYNWTREEPMKFFYRISEKIQKCVKRRKVVPPPCVDEDEEGGKMAKKITLLFNLSLAHDPKGDLSKSDSPPEKCEMSLPRRKSSHKKDKKKDKKRSGSRHKKKRFVAEPRADGDTSITLKLKASICEDSPSTTPVPSLDDESVDICDNSKVTVLNESASSDDVNSETDTGAMTIDETVLESAIPAPQPTTNTLSPTVPDKPADTERSPEGPVTIAKSTQCEALDLSQYSSRPLPESNSSSSSSSPVPTSPRQPASPKPKSGKGQSTQTILSIAESLAIKQRLQQKFQQTIGNNGISKEVQEQGKETCPAVVSDSPAMSKVSKGAKTMVPSAPATITKTKISITEPLAIHAKDKKPTDSSSSPKAHVVNPKVQEPQPKPAAPTHSSDLKGVLSAVKLIESRPKPAPSPRPVDSRPRMPPSLHRLAESRPKVIPPSYRHSEPMKPSGFLDSRPKVPLTLKIPKLPSHMSLEPTSPTNKDGSGVHQRKDLNEAPNITILPITKSPLKMPICNKIQRFLKDQQPSKSRPGEHIGRTPPPPNRIPRSPNQSVRTIPNPSLLRQQSQGRIQNCGAHYSSESTKFHDIEKLMRAIHHMDEPTVFCIPK